MYFESGVIMKYIDKFLKILKTDRNTFFTYILTLLSIYILIDRVVEMVILFFSGIGVSYWGPITYTFALACPVFAFLFSGASKFADSKQTKLTLFYLYYITLYVVGISMFVQWINYALWLLLLSVPNYIEIVTEFSDLIRPAFQSIAIYLPLTTFYSLVFKFLYTKVNDTMSLYKSIQDYSGIDLSDKKIGWGPYTCETTVCIDTKTGKPVKIPEAKRFEAMLVIGASGTGKTSMIFEPMIAKDLEKKFFFREVSKEMGYTALKTGIATITNPYTNEYLNEHFNLNMLRPVEGKEKIYKAYMNKMIQADKGDYGIIYKDIGITAVSPDYESTSHVLEIAKNYQIDVNIIDPSNPNSLGLNPFVYENPIQTSVAISSVLFAIHNSKMDVELAYRENAANQAIENISILLKEMYPRLHDGDLPTLEDVLDCLNDFSKVETLCHKLEENDELAKKYKLQLGYFKKYFYENSIGRNDMEKFTSASAASLDSLLRISGVRSILCKRDLEDNINYDKALANGEVTVVCTRRGDLGATTNKAFGLFFLMLMQYSVLRRPGNEKNRIPHFLYVDEFSDYICHATQSIFTLYRKYRVGTVISAQNIAQLGKDDKEKYKETILANCSTKVAFGNNTPEDNDWWSKEMGKKREWTFTNDYKTDKGEYDPNYKNIKWEWKNNIQSGEVQALKFKNCIIKTKDLKGKNIYAKGKVDFVESKYHEKHNSKYYNFDKFTNGIAEEDVSFQKKKTNKKSSFNNLENDEIDPIQMNNTNSKYLFDNEDAISFDLKKGKNNN